MRISGCPYFERRWLGDEVVCKEIVAGFCVQSFHPPQEKLIGCSELESSFAKKLLGLSPAKCLVNFCRRRLAATCCWYLF